MLYTAGTLKDFSLNSYDGEIGKVEQFYFDDRHWTIRYLVANTGSWLTGRQVLLSPYALVEVSSADEHISVNLTKKQIEESPSLISDKPVSRQFEQEYYGYYEWPMYWAGPYMWGSYSDIMRDRSNWLESSPDLKQWDPHLRSTSEVATYSIEASDGEIGHVVDFIIDDETWAIRYLIIETGDWWSGKKVLLSPRWIKHVSWSESKVIINLPRDIIKQSPEYSEGSLLSRDYEEALHQHYNCQGYWVADPDAKVYSR